MRRLPVKALEVRIRKARKGDIDRIIGIERSWQHLSHWSIDSYYRLLNDDSFTSSFVAETDGEKVTSIESSTSSVPGNTFLIGPSTVTTACLMTTVSLQVLSRRRMVKRAARSSWDSSSSTLPLMFRKSTTSLSNRLMRGPASAMN